MTNIVYIATSIDGYIARKDGNLDWLMEIPDPENSDYGFSEFMDRIDGIIIGRNTYETVIGFDQWPYTKPVFILSNTLKEVAGDVKRKAEIVSGKLEIIIDSLRKKGFENLYIDGGRTIQSFLQQNLIDELILTRIPIILGSGIPLFVSMDREIGFNHIETEIFDNTMVKSRYVRKK